MSDIKDVIDSFIQVLKDKVYSVHSRELAIFDIEYYPAHHTKYGSPNKLKASLNTFINKILFTVNESEIDIDYIKNEVINCSENYKMIKINEKRYFIQTDLITKEEYFDGEPKTKLREINISELEPYQLEAIETISKIKHEACLDFIKKIDEKLLRQGNNKIPSKKIQTNLSVSDIALLFRLLDDNKLISYKHKTEIYHFIASNFKTEKQSDISEASIKNKFLSPDNTALKNMNVILSNLKITLNNL